MTNCYSCTDGITCTTCSSPDYLDSGTYNCIEDCLTKDSYSK